jgi:hypothetical protein
MTFFQYGGYEAELVQYVCFKTFLGLVFFHEEATGICFHFVQTRSFPCLKECKASCVPYWKVFIDGGNDSKHGRNNITLVVIKVRLTVIMAIHTDLVIMGLIVGFWYYNIHHCSRFSIANNTFMSLNFVAMCAIVNATIGMLNITRTSLDKEAISKSITDLKGDVIPSIQVRYVEMGSHANALSALKERNSVLIESCLVCVNKILQSSNGILVDIFFFIGKVHLT